MYIIFTNKPDEYSSEPGPGIKALESWRYLFCGKERAVFTIGVVTDADARIEIIDADDSSCINSVPNKFFGDFADIDAARAEIEELIHFADIDASLEKVA